MVDSIAHGSFRQRSNQQQQQAGLQPGVSTFLAGHAQCSTYHIDCVVGQHCYRLLILTWPGVISSTVDCVGLCTWSLLWFFLVPKILVHSPSFSSLYFPSLFSSRLPVAGKPSFRFPSVLFVPYRRSTQQRRRLDLHCIEVVRARCTFCLVSQSAMFLYR